MIVKKSRLPPADAPAACLYGARGPFGEARHVWHKRGTFGEVRHGWRGAVPDRVRLQLKSRRVRSSVVILRSSVSKNSDSDDLTGYENIRGSSAAHRAEKRGRNTGCNIFFRKHIHMSIGNRKKARALAGGGAQYSAAEHKRYIFRLRRTGGKIQ